MPEKHLALSALDGLRIQLGALAAGIATARAEAPAGTEDAPDLERAAAAVGCAEAATGGIETDVRIARAVAGVRQRRNRLRLSARTGAGSQPGQPRGCRPTKGQDAQTARQHQRRQETCRRARGRR